MVADKTVVARACRGPVEALVAGVLVGIGVVALIEADVLDRNREVAHAVDIRSGEADALHKGGVDLVDVGRADGNPLSVLEEVERRIGPGELERHETCGHGLVSSVSHGERGVLYGEVGLVRILVILAQERSGGILGQHGLVGEHGVENIVAAVDIDLVLVVLTAVEIERRILVDRSGFAIEADAVVAHENYRRRCGARVDRVQAVLVNGIFERVHLRGSGIGVLSVCDDLIVAVIFQRVGVVGVVCGHPACAVAYAFDVVLNDVVADVVRYLRVVRGEVRRRASPVRAMVGGIVPPVDACTEDIVECRYGGVVAGGRGKALDHVHRRSVGVDSPCLGHECQRAAVDVGVLLNGICLHLEAHLGGVTLDEDLDLLGILGIVGALIEVAQLNGRTRYLGKLAAGHGIVVVVGRVAHGEAVVGTHVVVIGHVAPVDERYVVVHGLVVAHGVDEAHDIGRKLLALDDLDRKRGRDELLDGAAAAGAAARLHVLQVGLVEVDYVRDAVALRVVEYEAQTLDSVLVVAAVLITVGRRERCTRRCRVAERDLQVAHAVLLCGVAVGGSVVGRARRCEHACRQAEQ